MSKMITDSFKLALAQLNPVVGDIAGNMAKARAARADAAANGADLIVFTELYLDRLSDRGSGAEAGLAACGAGGLRGVGARHARRRPGNADWACPGPRGRSSTTPWRFWTKAASRPSASRPIFPITVCSTRSGSSRRDRCRSRSKFGACRSACRSARIFGARRFAERSPKAAPSS